MKLFRDKDVWSYPIRGRDIRFSETDLSQTAKDRKSQSSYKLTGLKENTVVEELDTLKELLNIKALIIPEIKTNLGTVRKERFAIAYIEENHLFKENMVIKTKEHTFYAIGFSNRHCPHCGHWAHKEKECNDKLASVRKDGHKGRISVPSELIRHAQFRAGGDARPSPLRQRTRGRGHECGEGLPLGASRRHVPRSDRRAEPGSGRHARNAQPSSSRPARGFIAFPHRRSY